LEERLFPFSENYETTLLVSFYLLLKKTWQQKKGAKLKPFSRSSVPQNVANDGFSSIGKAKGNEKRRASGKPALYRDT
jgi:hypothetical protein